MLRLSARSSMSSCDPNHDRLWSIVALQQRKVVRAGTRLTPPPPGICAFQPVGKELRTAMPRRKHTARTVHGYAEFARVWLKSAEERCESPGDAEAVTTI